MDRAGVARIADALEKLKGDLEELARAGRGIPAVEKNALRMRGALRILDAQFAELAALEKEAG